MSQPPTIEALLSHGSWVRGLARGLVLDDARADDLAQDAWLAAIRRPPRDPGAAPSWFRRVLRNSARMRHREESSRARREEAAARPERLTAQPSEVVERAEIHRRLVDHVLALDEPYRTTVLLRFFEGRSPRKISLEMHAPLSTVHSRLANALELLRRRLDRDHGGDREVWRALLVPLAGLAGLAGTAASTSQAAASTASSATTSTFTATTTIATGGILMTAKTVTLTCAAAAAFVAFGVGIGTRISSQDTLVSDLRSRGEAAAARVRALELELAARSRMPLGSPPAASGVAPAVATAKTAPSPDATPAVAPLSGLDEVRKIFDDLEAGGFNGYALTADDFEATLAKRGRTTELLVAAAYMSGDPGTARAYLEEALDADPESPLALLALVEAQVKNGEAPAALASSIDALKRSDPLNSLPHLFSAKVKLDGGDVQGALEDLQQAAACPRLVAHRSTLFHASEKFYEDAGHGDGAAGALAAIGLPVAYVPALHGIARGLEAAADARFAGGDSAGGFDLLRPLHELARMLSTGGRTVLEEAGGAAMETACLEREMKAHEAAGNSAAAADAARRLELIASRVGRYRALAGSYFDALRQAASEREVARFFDSIFSDGEVEAAMRLPGLRESILGEAK